MVGQALPDMSGEVLSGVERMGITYLRWPGGKARAAKMLVDNFPRDINEYREPLIGGGSVFFEAKSRGVTTQYWINDKFYELINFWKICQDPMRNQITQEKLRYIKEMHPDDLKGQFRHCQQFPDSFGMASQEAQAAGFFLVNRCSFSGATYAGGFSKDASVNRFTHTAIDRLGELPDKLRGVKITFGDYAELLQAPGKGVFIFLDPPYMTAKKLYGRSGVLHTEFDHERLVLELAKCKHKWMLTYDDTPEIRKMYALCSIHEFRLQYAMTNAGGNQSRKGNELMITNYGG